MNKQTRLIGVITNISGNYVEIDFHGEIKKYAFPSAFYDILEIEDEDLQIELSTEGSSISLKEMIRTFEVAINKEITYVKITGGKKYRMIDGELMQKDSNSFIYSFDTDTDVHFPDSSPIKLWTEYGVFNATILSSEDFSIIIRTSEYLGEKVDIMEFTADSWQLLEALNERLDEVVENESPIARQIICDGRKKIDPMSNILLGQDSAFIKAMSDEITFIWGPPGTGKTYTLSKIAIESIKRGERVLMLSYSNVSVDGAVLRVSEMYDLAPRNVVRYGYPRNQALITNDFLSSYRIVLNENPELYNMADMLNKEKKKLPRKDPRRAQINNELAKIRKKLSDKEKELIANVPFVGTTVTKAVIDPAIYNQRFDVVIFDEASMAYIPQIVYAASLAKSRFICLGDFRQLPAIVQNSDNKKLTQDIFEYTGIESAVDNNIGHDWLVMLDTQHRMHPDIAHFVSESQYKGLLKSHEKMYIHRQNIADLSPSNGDSMCMIDLSGMYSVCTKTMDQSRINVLSAMISVATAVSYNSKYEVGIITPYNAQSRLIVAMLRDLQEKHSQYKSITCATVHQFQGSEKPIIIYDAVDCYRMPYIGTLLTSMQNNTADRLFNVAVTRAQGKFILVCNKDYFSRKRLSKKLMLSKGMTLIEKNNSRVKGIPPIYDVETQYSQILIANINDTWTKYFDDISKAKKSIIIDIPGIISDDEETHTMLTDTFHNLSANGVKIIIRHEIDNFLPFGFEKYSKPENYITNPLTIIDETIVWFGQPLCEADFVSEGTQIHTEYKVAARFAGHNFARLVQVFFGM